MTPTAAMSTDSGAALPAPLPDGAVSPPASGTRNAMENTGPISPTDCATASISVSFLLPPSVLFAPSRPWSPRNRRRIR